MTPMKLPGLDGSHLFGFLATFGLMRLLHLASSRDQSLHPRLHFDEADDCAVLTGVPSLESLEEIVWRELQAFRDRLMKEFGSVEVPSKLHEKEEVVNGIASAGDRSAMDELAGLGCIVAGKAQETALSAANGAGHQKLLVSMRDALALLERHRHLLQAAWSRPWTMDFEPSEQDRKELNLGSRKPTLRFDPGDERLYALRFGDPGSQDSPYRTELGAQALAAAALGGLPVVPRQPHAITAGSERKGTKTYFYWGLWNTPATYPAIRSCLAIGIRKETDFRARGFFAAFRAARVTGSKGKLSFSPTEPWW